MQRAPVCQIERDLKHLGNGLLHSAGQVKKGAVVQGPRSNSTDVVERLPPKQGSGALSQLSDVSSDASVICATLNRVYVSSCMRLVSCAT